MVQRNALNIPWTYSAAKMTRTGANQGIATGTGATQVIFGGTNFTYGGDLTTDAANNRIIVNNPGVYYLAAAVSFDGNNTGRRWLQVTTNGTGRARLEIGPPGNAAGTWSVEVTTTMALSAGDLITADVSQTSGVTLQLINMTYPPYLMATRVA